MLAPPPRRPALPTSISTPSLPPSKALRPLPIKRRSTLKRSIDESSLMDTPSSPSKRSRVTFDSDVEIVSADDEEDFDPLVVKENVRRAIERHRFNDNEGYDRLQNVFNTPHQKPNAPPTKVLKIHLQAVLANVTALTKDCNGLVNAVLNSEWVGREESYYALFVRFLNNLAAAQRGYQHKIMSVLVDLLGPQKTRRVGEAKPVRQPVIHRRVLQAIRHITVNVPSAPAALANQVSSRLEFDFQKAEERMTYIRNFMEMIRYVPELTSEILTCVLRELIKLDVSVQVDLDEDEDDAEDDILNYMSSSMTLVPGASQDMLKSGIDDDNDDMSTTDDDSDMEEDEDVDPATARRQKLKEGIKQIDWIMDILFQYYAKLTTSTTLQVRDTALEQLITQFHSQILPTYRARHPQFLVFHFAQSDPIAVDRFVTSCVTVLIDRKQPHLLRHSAAAYFSGFIGRGAHVSPQVVQDCVGLLCGHLNLLRKLYEPSCRGGPDIKRYGDFYSIFQAILYIFCFRWRDIASASSDDESDFDIDEEEVETYHFTESLREALRAAIYSPLNPLRVCTPVIVEQFAKLTHALQLFYVYPKLEENRHVRVNTHWHSMSDLSISTSTRDLSWVGDNGMLEGYFPYDPYHLPISKHWIEGDYVEWKGIPGEQADDTDSESDAGMDVGDMDEDEEDDGVLVGDDSDDE
ncbi:DNA independent RNA polymerase I transcription factor [Elasticomyces elasticus]|uniref:DNA independent RNA polymerase I transcription factor n=1 Tax=Exophiala sideris TaxID=1016849 RepID=A0ABR0JHK9_9EURO|nr:DNA independent RNA polymerase I transcription factor [Elasticomyces elasticus]KAK5033448.1 DNA independent RNA polymerase I transcription factor [Exophiala sideris]KAK5042057.1 DNA independent RNA polymerase I transcription factor [Exophiala sideris]KAK5063992.1 DNA independent RNA polymerase I transcription factor [Exophiala sideris]KAK5185325.1 DNA independent RNA polymerase I transcription factor [Eurotiomycetes sp. CCFEE 6388]